MATKDFNILLLVRVQGQIVTQPVEFSAPLEQDVSLECDFMRYRDPGFDATASFTVDDAVLELVLHESFADIEMSSSMNTRLPSYVSVDFTKLSFPFEEGRGYTVKLTEGFYIQDAPNLDGRPNPAGELVTFTAGKRFRSDFVSNFTSNIDPVATYGIDETFTNDVNLISTPNFTWTPVLQFDSVVDLISNPVATKRIDLTLSSTTDISANPVAQYSQSADINTDFTLSIIAYNTNFLLESRFTIDPGGTRLRFGSANFETEARFDAESLKVKLFECNMSSQFDFEVADFEPMTFEVEIDAGDLTDIDLILGSLDGTIDWGDGNIENGNGNSVFTHTYGTSGLYNVTVRGVSDKFSGDNKIKRITNWGDLGFSTLSALGSFDRFTGSQSNGKLIEVPNYIPKSVTSLLEAFELCPDFNDPNIISWDTSNVTNMEQMFRNAISFNQPLNNWDTSNATNMEQMFWGASSFNQDLNNWNTSNVTSMEQMFAYATLFNGDISTWDVSSIQFNGFRGMFWGASSFNQSLNNWNTSNAADMALMFEEASSFNQPLNNWNTSSVTSMIRMFRNASSFNQPLNNWDTSNVTDMDRMFFQAFAFDQDISSWCVELIPSKPELFDYQAGFDGQTAKQPNWGDPC